MFAFKHSAGEFGTSGTPTPDERRSSGPISLHNAIGRFFARLSRRVQRAGVARPLTYLLGTNVWLERLITVASDYQLDFDDAYQYVAAERNDVTLVSFDGDFDDTELGELTPREAMARQDAQR